MIINKYKRFKNNTFHGSLLNEIDDINSYKANEAFQEAIQNFMDFHDRETNNKLHSLNEEEQNSFLVSLTNKLYRSIIGKVDEIDYGDIPNTKGDITKLPKYKEIKETIKTLREIFDQYKESPKPIQEIENALIYIEDYKTLFVSCYAGKIELGIMMYNNIVLSIIASLSLMIAVCIEYVKSTKNDGLEVVLKKTKISKVKDSILYESLVKFNDASRKGDIENALRPLIKSKARNSAAVLTPLIFGLISIVGIVMACVSMLNDLAYFFYATRVNVSQYFELQSNLLKMNVETLKNSDIETVDDKQRVINRQIAIAERFHKIADYIAFDNVETERKATEGIKKENRNYKIDDVTEDDDNGSIF